MPTGIAWNACSRSRCPSSFKTTTLYSNAALCAALFVGCGGGPPRRPTPPTKDESLRRERFAILGAGDNWNEPLPIVDGLKRMGGVKDCSVEEETGKFVVVYDPRRTHRDAIGQRVRQIGREQGRDYEALFDDR